MKGNKIKIGDIAKVEKLQEESYQIPVLQTREELIDFLIRNKAYPYCSKTGKIFFRRLKKAEDEDTNFGAGRGMERERGKDKWTLKS
jgi:hypothetical protein